MASSARRAALVIATTVLSLALAACGFHLRGEAHYAFNSVFVNAPAAPLMAAVMDWSIR